MKRQGGFSSLGMIVVFCVSVVGIGFGTLLYKGSHRNIRAIHEIHSFHKPIFWRYPRGNESGFMEFFKKVSILDKTIYPQSGLAAPIRYAVQFHGRNLALNTMLFGWLNYRSEAKGSLLEVSRFGVKPFTYFIIQTVHRNNCLSAPVISKLCLYSKNSRISANRTVSDAKLNVGYDEPGQFNTNSGLSRHCGGVGRFFGDVKRSLSFYSLPLASFARVEPQFIGVFSENPGYSGQQQRNTSENSGPDNEPPLIRRFVLAIASLGITVLLAFLYCDWVIDGHGKRRILGLALCGLGILFGLTGIALLFLTGFRWSWGWWI